MGSKDPAPEKSSSSTFTVSLDGTTVNVSPSSHGTQHLSKTFHVVIDDGSATFPETGSILFEENTGDIFQVDWQSPSCVEIKDKPLDKPGKKRYPFEVCVVGPDGKRYRSSDPTIVNDPHIKA